MENSILLIGPYSGPNLKKTKFLAPPIGIHRLASLLRKKGYKADVFDPNLYEDAKAELKGKLKENYSITGISSTHMTLENDASLTYYIREHSPQSVIIAGGIEATFNWKQLFDISKTDLMVMGEGDRPLIEIAQRLNNRNNLYQVLKDVNGLRIRHDGNIIHTRYNPQLTWDEFREATFSYDFSKIPFEQYWSPLEEEYGKIGRTIRLFTSNYCPYDCNFCSATHFLDEAAGINGTKRSKLVYLDAEDLLKLVYKAISAYPSVNVAAIQDDNFMMKGRLQKRAGEFCDLIIEEKDKGNLPRDLEFMCQTRVDDVGEGLLKKMKEAGFSLIGYGVEGFTDNVLKDLNKRVTNDQNLRTINLTLNANIPPYLNTIIAPPNANLDDVLTSIEYSLMYAEKGAQVGAYLFVLPFPGSTIVDREDVKELIVYEKTSVPDTNVSFLKSIKILPRNTLVRDTLLETEENFPQIQERFKEKYKLKHTATSFNSMVLFYSILNSLMKKKIETSSNLERIENIMKRNRGGILS